MYGLGPKFDGFRWLIIWQASPPLYSISLGHGRPEAGEWVSVQTIKKLPPSANRFGVTVGPTGLSDAVSSAIMRLSELSVSDRNRLTRMMNDEYSMIDLYPDRGVSALAGVWETEELLTDGVPRVCYSRRLEKAWAVVLELEEVAVAVTGPASTASLDLEIVDVRSSLASYA